MGKVFNFKFNFSNVTVKFVYSDSGGSPSTSIPPGHTASVTDYGDNSTFLFSNGTSKDYAPISDLSIRFDRDFKGYYFEYLTILSNTVRERSESNTYKFFTDNGDDIVITAYYREQARVADIYTLGVEVFYFDKNNRPLIPNESDRPTSLRVSYLSPSGAPKTENTNEVSDLVGIFERISEDFSQSTDVIGVFGGFGNVDILGAPSRFSSNGIVFTLQSEVSNVPSGTSRTAKQGVVQLVYKALDYPQDEEEPETPPRPVVYSYEDITLEVDFDPDYDGNIPNNLVTINGRGVSSSRLTFKQLAGGSRLYTYKRAQVGLTYSFNFANVRGYKTPRTLSVRAGGSYTAVYKRVVIPNPRIVINTRYIPNPEIDFTRGVIFVDGRRVGVGRATVTLTPGEHIISFGDIKVLGYTFNTPDSISINVRAGESRTVTGTYEGYFNPESYWLKPIDDIDSQYLAFEKIEGLFSNDIKNLTTMFTSSDSSSYGDYLIEVYHEHPTVVTSSVQFSLSYGHYSGYGSDNFDNNDPNNTPTKGVYGQYRNKILGNSKGKFNLTGVETDHFYVINYQHERVQNALDYGAFEINLAHLSGSEFVAGGGALIEHTGSNVTLAGNNSVLRLITSEEVQVGVYGKSYDIISGSIEDGVYNPTEPHVYGKMYVNHGAVLLDADKLNLSASFGTVDVRETNGSNFAKLYTSISGAAQITDASGDLLGMKARRKIIEFNDYYFLHLTSEEFNRTNNTTYFSGSEGSIVSDSLISADAAYITTIGLYNTNKELLAVGKLSKPVKKDSKTEKLFRVRLKH